MNAALLLVTTAWLAGADAAPAAAAPVVVAAPAAAAPAPYGGSCGCNSCGSSCECGCDCGCECKESCLHKLMAHFHHNKCDCCDTCGCDTCSSCAPATTSCGSCGASCGCETSCGCECHESCLHKLMAHFHHNKCDCCDSCGCDSCGGCGSTAYAAPGAPVVTTPGAMPKAGEPIPAPKGSDMGKPMPSGGKEGGKDKDKGTTTKPPVGLNSQPSPIAAPSLELAPAGADSKEPF